MVTLSRKHLFFLTAVLLVLLLGLVACERPFPRSGEGDGTETTTPVVDTAVDPTIDSNVGGGVGESEPTAVTPEPSTVEEAGGEAEATVEATVASEATPAEEGEMTEEGSGEAEEQSQAGTEDEAAEVGGGAPESQTEETGSETTESSEGEATTTEDSSGEAASETPSEETADAADATTAPRVHVVQPGENLYRIGLQYGISWVQLAEFNSLSNANRLVVGQIINIPGSSTEPPPTPSPSTETTYTVRAGDTLHRIGRSFGISWVPIAEANGLVNPNLIYPGMVLKIPVDTPGSRPDFTHTVRAGETLFRISLQYGVSWQAIAEANDLSSPYVIYTGQALTIPGNGDSSE